MTQALEHAAFAAWPALEEMDYAGWRLRFANGYTKRANSANAIGDAGATEQLTAAQIDHIEAFYRARGAPAIFRLASFCTSQAVDDALAERGYRFADMSLVMTKSLGETGSAHACELLQDAATWLQTCRSISGVPDAADDKHLAILSAIKSRCAFAVSRRSGVAACSGLGVVDGDHLGLFDIETHSDARRAGLATQLCAGLLHWGARQGAKTAFLQVVASNVEAIRLYEKLGFRRSYHYWYRVQSTGKDAA